LELQKAVQRRRQEVLNYFQNVKNLREHEMQEIALKMQSDKGIEELVHQLHWGKSSTANVAKRNSKAKKTKTKRPVQPAEEQVPEEGDRDPDEQVKEFKAANKKQIKDLKNGRT
jgi:hypothetical protein